MKIISYSKLLFLCIFLATVLNLSAKSSADIAQTQKISNEINSNREFFIKNQGEYPANIKYYAKLNGFSFWLTNNQFIYDFYKYSSNSNNSSNINGLVVKFNFNNSSSNYSIEPETAANSKITFIIPIILKTS